jgi:hypothetical protein
LSCTQASISWPTAYKIHRMTNPGAYYCHQKEGRLQIKCVVSAKYGKRRKSM